MGLAIWERRGWSGPNGAAALLAGVAAIALFVPPANAQQSAQAAGEQADQSKQAEQEKPAPAGATLLDKVLVISRTGETAIQSLASASHVDQKQLDRRMATTPNEMLFGVPGVAAQADARRVSTSVNIRGLQVSAASRSSSTARGRTSSVPTMAPNRPSTSTPSLSNPSTSSVVRSPTPMVRAR